MRRRTSNLKTNPKKTVNVRKKEKITITLLLESEKMYKIESDLLVRRKKKKKLFFRRYLFIYTLSIVIQLSTRPVFYFYGFTTGRF